MSAKSSSPLRAAILVVSDTAAMGASVDKTIPQLTQTFVDSGIAWQVVDSKIVPDSVVDIQRAIQQWTDTVESPHLVITSGGTGFASKDQTPEAVAPLLHRQASGLVHAMLSASLAVTPFAMMARPVAGTRHSTLILTLPGSPKGACENLSSVIKLLPHACTQAKGADSRMLHAGGIAKLERDAGLATSSGPRADNASPGDASTPLIHHAHSHDHSHSHSHGHEAGHGHHHHAPKPHTTSDARARYYSNDLNAGPADRARASPYRMLSVTEALELIATTVPAPRIEARNVDQQLVGHVLADDVAAAESVPAYRASIVDGYAVHCDDNGKSTKGVFMVAYASHAKAGSDTGIPELRKSDVARITTGAPLPPGADAVVMVEDTVVKSRRAEGSEENEVEVLTNEVKRGENVREAGSDVRSGDIIMRKGEGVTAIGGEFGLLASVGTTSVQVYRKPVIGVLSTGDEIIPHNRPEDLRLGEVRDTNRPTLLTAATGTGFQTLDLGIASDTAESLENKLRAALSKVDVLITSGGVSMGELDLLKPTIERALGGTIHFGRVSMKPGKPTTFATVPASNIKDPYTGARDGGAGSWNEKVIFALPGNPASAVVTYMLFVLPALHRMSGVEPAGLPMVQVKLENPIKGDTAREEYHRAVVYARNDGLWASSTGGQRSSRIGSFKGANALLKVPVGAALAAEAYVDALLMAPILGVSNRTT